MSAPPTDPQLASSPSSIPVQALKLAVVTRRFWPYSGMAEMAVSDLATEMRREGHSVDMVTISWERSWPKYFQFQELPVHRVNRPTPGPWGSFRYVRALTRLLGELNVNGMIIFGLGDEAWAINRKFGGKIPYVIRIDDQLLEKRKRVPQFSARQVAALNAAASVTVESEWMKQRIANHAGVNQRSITVVPEGIRIPSRPVRDPTAYASSRVAISDAHPVLMIGPTQPLVVCGAPLEGDAGWFDLINAWTRVLNRLPKAKLWILGDGRRGRQVWEQMLEKNLVHSIIMPGSFDDLDDVMQAADVVVHPLQSDESCGFLCRAMAAGVCPVATSTEATRNVVEDNVNGIMVDKNQPGAMADAIVRVLANRELRERLGSAASSSPISAYDIKRLIPHYLEPLTNPPGQINLSTNNLPASNPTSQM